MAPRSNTSPTKWSLLFFILTIFSCSSEAYDYHNLKETNMTLYVHDISSGSNATSVIVTGVPGQSWSYFTFGTIIVSDDLITAGPNKSSTELGRAQGTYTIASLNAANAQVQYTIGFTNKEYNGSTLEIQGSFAQFANVTETAVVGGTGKFRRFTGYATFEAVFYDATQFYTVTRCNVTVKHS